MRNFFAFSVCAAFACQWRIVRRLSTAFADWVPNPNRARRALGTSSVPSLCCQLGLAGRAAVSSQGGLLPAGDAPAFLPCRFLPFPVAFRLPGQAGPAVAAALFYFWVPQMRHRPSSRRLSRSPRIYAVEGPTWAECLLQRERPAGATGSPHQQTVALVMASSPWALFQPPSCSMRLA